MSKAWIFACLFLISGAAPHAAEAPTVQQAVQSIGAGDWAAAAATLEALTAAQPDNARAWSMLGLARRRTGDLDGALASLERARGFEQTAAAAMYNIGCIHAVSGDEKKALKWLRRARATGKIDITAALLDPDLAELVKTRKFRRLLPDAADYAKPFVEGADVIHEWVAEAAGDQFGWIARDIGDVTGDGVHDLTTSAPSRDAAGAAAGRVYVYSGGDGKLLWRRDGRAGDQLGQGIEAAGDVNADGVRDVIAGAPGGNRALVFSGSDGTLLLTMESVHEGEAFGGSVSDIGDLDGDGHDDLLVGAAANDGAGTDSGRAGVYSGRDGSLLIEWSGEGAGDAFGSAVAGLTREGVSWIVVGAPDAGESQGGRVYVYKGRRSEPHFVIDADETGAQLGGMFVSVVGDVDADGTPDIYASDWANNAKGRSTGRVYVHSGRDGARLYTFTGEAAGDGFGIGAADAGDVNGDGHDDLVIGAWQHGSAAPSGGKVYLYSGKDGSLSRSWTGRVPGETFGFDATGLGDVNGDGSIDLLLTSAWSTIRGGRSGRMFVVSSR